MEGTETEKSKRQSSEANEPAIPPSLHIYADEDMVKKLLDGYKTDKDFASLITRMAGEPPDSRKHRAYRLSDKGLLYFEDADCNV